MQKPLVTVIEAASFMKIARKLLSGDELDDLILSLAGNPEQGVLLVPGSGLRKMRFGRGNKGKSGGIRVIYACPGDRRPVFLLALFAKNEQDNLSPKELKALAKAAENIDEGD